MPEVQIDKLTLRLANADRSQGERLAQKLASALAKISLESDLPVRKESVRVRVQPAPGAAAEHLARQIVHELISELRRS